jgi:hypothetical protein
LFFKNRLYGLRNNDEISWKEALNKDTVSAYRNFYLKFPNSRYAEEAKMKVVAFEEEIIWKQARLKNTISEYDYYISKYPQGRYILNAQMIIDKLAETYNDKARETSRAFINENEKKGRKKLFKLPFNFLSISISITIFSLLLTFLFIRPQYILLQDRLEFEKDTIPEKDSVITEGSKPLTIERTKKVPKGDSKPLEEESTKQGQIPNNSKTQLGYSNLIGHNFGDDFRLSIDARNSYQFRVFHISSLDLNRSFIISFKMQSYLDLGSIRYGIGFNYNKDTTFYSFTIHTAKNYRMGYSIGWMFHERLAKAGIRLNAEDGPDILSIKKTSEELIFLINNNEVWRTGDLHLNNVDFIFYVTDTSEAALLSYSLTYL